MIVKQLKGLSIPYKKLAFICVLFCTTACGGGMDISNKELIKKMAECNASSNKTPGMAVACGNYIDECKRRGEKSGNYIC